MLVAVLFVILSFAIQDVVTGIRTHALHMDLVLAIILLLHNINALPIVIALKVGIAAQEDIAIIKHTQDITQAAHQVVNAPPLNIALMMDIAQRILIIILTNHVYQTKQLILHVVLQRQEAQQVV